MGVSVHQEERDFQYFERYSVNTAYSERFSTLSSVDSTRGMSMDRSSKGRDSIPPPTIVENLSAAGQAAPGQHGIGYREQDLIQNGHEDSTDYPSVFDTVDTIEVIKKVIKKELIIILLSPTAICHWLSLYGSFHRRTATMRQSSLNYKKIKIQLHTR